MKKLTENMRQFTGGVVVGCVISFFFTLFIYLLLNKNSEYDRGSKHVRIMINRNCNDCHVGKSFVMLFDHEFIKSEKAKDNSVVIDSMLSSSKLKVY